MKSNLGRTRRFHFWLILIWIGIGGPVSWLLKSSVPWVTFMSWYAIVITHAGAWGAGRAEDAVNNK